MSKAFEPTRRSRRRSGSTEPDRALAFLARLAAEFTTVLNLSDLLEHVLQVLHEEIGFDSCTVARDRLRRLECVRAGGGRQ